jgi:AcrR family transcriptional regulator
MERYTQRLVTSLSSPPSSPLSVDDSGSPEGEPMGKRERNKLDKQRRIVAAATELFQEKGFEETTTAEIASRARIGAGTLYLYVDSKEDLLVSAFMEVAGGAWARGFELVNPHDSLVDQLMTVFTTVTEHHHQDRRLSFAFLKELPYVNLKARDGLDSFHDWFFAELEAVLGRASETGRLDPDAPRRTLARNLYAIWIVQLRRLVSDEVSYERLIGGLQERIEVALYKMIPEA